MADERQAELYTQVIIEQAMNSWLQPLQAIASSVTISGLTEILDSRELEFSKKQELLHNVFSPDTSAQIQNFIFLLASKNDIHLLPEIITGFNRHMQHRSLATCVHVSSAVALTESEKNLLEIRLFKQFGKDIDLQYQIDPKILGGVIIHSGDVVIDGSVSGKLNALEKRLK